MATLYVTEFPSAAVDQGRAMPIAYAVNAINNNVSISGSSTQSNAFNANTLLVRLHTDTVCSVRFGTNPTALSAAAATADMRMAANQTEYFAVPKGGNFKVAVITNGL